jgi:hypothetical protein
MEFTAVRNNQSIPLAQIPQLDYERFYDLNTGLVIDNPQCHCVNYYGYSVGNGVMLICAIANDADGQIYLSKCEVLPSQTLDAFTKKHLVLSGSSARYTRILALGSMAILG